MTETPDPDLIVDDTADPAPQQSPKPLSPAAGRALAEAEARRRETASDTASARPEIGGRGGPDPARYGDWEIGGRAIDF